MSYLAEWRDVRVPVPWPEHWFAGRVEGRSDGRSPARCSPRAEYASRSASYLHVHSARAILATKKRVEGVTSGAVGRGVGRGPDIPGSRLYRWRESRIQPIFTSMTQWQAPWHLRGDVKTGGCKLQIHRTGSLASLHPASSTTLAKGLYIRVRISKLSGLKSLSPPNSVCYKSMKRSMYCKDI